MVNVDTVYQRVLAIANKEQRGYITPQEFNLFANQAQMDIFEQYFYDINQFGRLPGNDTSYSDMLNYLEEKISIFESSASGTNYPGDMYKIGSVRYLNNLTYLNIQCHYQVFYRTDLYHKNIAQIYPSELGWQIS